MKFNKAINDVKGVYRTVNGKRVVCPYYARWAQMINRAYNPKFHLVQPTYKGVQVCEKWLTFSNFKVWMQGQNWEGLELDKDILVNGNNIYSEDNCRFVPKRINNLLSSSKNSRGQYPLGVCFAKKTSDMVNDLKNCYTASINKGAAGSVYLGKYPTPEKAHAVWQKEKVSVIQDAVAWYAEQDYFDTLIADALIGRSWKIMLDIATARETTNV